MKTPIHVATRRAAAWLACGVALCACPAASESDSDAATEAGSGSTTGGSTTTAASSGEAGPETAGTTDPTATTGPCVPDCGEQQCGLDPICGTSCGACDENGTCIGGQCSPAGCAPNCSPLVEVPEGAFEMGCNEAVDEACLDDELPAHTVTLAAFEIDQFEVTIGEYAACVAVGACTDLNGPCASQLEEGDDQPVGCATWSQAQSYCGWTGRRLPTEAEWEKAARGTDGALYPWGDEAPTCDNAVMTECDMTTQPVGSKPAGVSPYGAHDMLGNAREWVADWYDEGYYAISPSVDPTGPDSGDFKIRRGGDFNASASTDNMFGVQLRASSRVPDGEGISFAPGGFRCAR